MDPLSDVLSLLRPHTYVSGGFEVGGNISVQFGPYEGIKCYAVVYGQCWLAVEGMEPVLLTADDCFLLPHGRPFRLATDLSLKPVDAMSILASKCKGNNGRLTVINGGGDGCIVGGHFAFTGKHARMLLDVLPPMRTFGKSRIRRRCGGRSNA